MIVPEPKWMTDELRILRDGVRRLYEQEFAPHEERWCKQGEVDRRTWQLAAENGLLCASIPEEYGGGGGTFAHDAVLFYEQLRAGVSSFGNTLHSGIVAHYILAFGTEAQRQRWLPGLAHGDFIGALALSESGGGSDLKAIRTRATPGPRGWRLNGSKTFISNGGQANLVLVAARTSDGGRAEDLSILVVETDTSPGFRRGRKLEKLGLHGQDTSELFFDDCDVDGDAVLGGEPGQGFAQMMRQLPRERLIVAVMALGTIDRALETTIAYVKQRRAFGKTLLELQNTRFKLAEAQTEARIAHVFVEHCVESLLAGTLDTPTAAMAKYWTTEVQCRVVDICLQLHGGYGYMLEYPIARMYLDSRIQPIYGGTNEIMKEIIARAL
jgi:acyl-CoA dehydrogenase